MGALDTLFGTKEKDVKDLGNWYLLVSWDYLNTNFSSVMDDKLF